jgi:hypothetical protein
MIMDIKICLNRLNKFPESLTLTQSNPPHEIVRWEGGDPQPTEAELQAAWNAYQAEGGTEKIEAKEKRASAYRSEADPLFFKAQRGEATTDEWTAKVAEIKARFPYPEGEAQ